MLRTTIVVAALFAVAAAVPIVDRDLLPVIDHSKINEINSMQVLSAPCCIFAYLQLRLASFP